MHRFIYSYGNVNSTQHFKLSNKSKELLDKSMAVLDMGRVCHTNIIPIHYTMAIMNLKKEERDKFFQADNVFNVKLIADLEVIMHHKLKRYVTQLLLPLAAGKAGDFQKFLVCRAAPLGGRGSKIQGGLKILINFVRM